MIIEVIEKLYEDHMGVMIMKFIMGFIMGFIQKYLYKTSGILSVASLLSLIIIGQVDAGFTLWSSKGLEKEPLFSKNSMHIEPVLFNSRENVFSEKQLIRKGILMTQPGAKATVVISHGFMCNKYDVGFLRQIFTDCNVLTYDFRAHGEQTDGQLCTFGHNEAYDVIAAAQFLKKHPLTKDTSLIGYGFSMGAVATIEAQSKNPLFTALILDCPFDSSDQVVKKSLDNLKISVFGYQMDIPGKSILEKYAFHPYVQSTIKTLLKTVTQIDTQKINMHMMPTYPVKSIKAINVPCFFIHCKNDEKITIEAVKRVFHGAQGPKKLWLTNGRNHYDSFFYNPEKYTQRVRKFVDKVLDGTFKHKNKIIEDAPEDLERRV